MRSDWRGAAFFQFVSLHFIAAQLERSPAFPTAAGAGLQRPGYLAVVSVGKQKAQRELALPPKVSLHGSGISGPGTTCPYRQVILL